MAQQQKKKGRPKGDTTVFGGANVVQGYIEHLAKKAKETGTVQNFFTGEINDCAVIVQVIPRGIKLKVEQMNDGEFSAALMEVIKQG